MQSNSIRARSAHSGLSTLPVPQTASMSRPHGGIGTVGKVAIGAIACVALLGASIAHAADNILEVNLPYVQAWADSGSSRSFDWCARGLEALCSQSDPDRPIEADAQVDGADAGIGVGSTDMTVASASSQAGAGVSMLMYYVVEDPQHRPQIKTILDFAGVAQTIPDPIGSVRSAGAVWQVKLGESTGGDVYLSDNGDGSWTVVRAPQFVGSPVLEMEIGAYSGSGGSCLSRVAMHDQLVSNDYQTGCASITKQGSLDLTHAPGTYLMSVVATAQDRSTVAADPVLRPHPDNPDVIVTRLAPRGSPGAPLAGTTPAELAAQGFDPTPFIEAGLFGPSGGPSDPPPPTPPADKNWCGPGFWLNNATKFGGSAWPVPAPTYHDYNSTARQLAGCPIATGNPTLLEVLKNPGRYFAEQSKDAGFKCVADYLSHASGLPGTSADNNGVCSIDQLGRHME